MITRVMPRRIEAPRTRDPDSIAQIIGECDTVLLPYALHNVAADVVRTIKANTMSQFEQPEIIASYIMRYALLLNRTGQLVEHSQTKHRKDRRL